MRFVMCSLHNSSWLISSSLVLVMNNNSIRKYGPLFLKELSVVLWQWKSETCENSRVLIIWLVSLTKAVKF